MAAAHWLVCSCWLCAWNALHACSMSEASCSRSPPLSASGLICTHAPEYTAHIILSIHVAVHSANRQHAC